MGNKTSNSAGNPERRIGGMSFLLTRAAEIVPNHPICHYLATGKIITYIEMEERVNKLSRALIKIGINKGDKVTYAFSNEPRALETLFALAKIGAVSVPLITRLKDTEALNYIREMQCRAAIADVSLTSLVKDAKLEIYVVANTDPDNPAPIPGAYDYEDLLSSEDGSPLKPSPLWEDPYTILMTAGTTSFSKGVLVGHMGNLIDILSVVTMVRTYPDINTLCYAPVYHGAALNWVVFPVMWQCGTIYFPADPIFSPQECLEQLQKGHIDYMGFVPAMIGLLHKNWDKKPMHGVKSLAVFSAPTPEKSRGLLREMFPDAKLHNGYGISENLSVCCQDNKYFLDKGRAAGRAGLATRVRIVDDDGRFVSHGTVGEIVCRGFDMGLRYVNNAESTDATWRTVTDDPEGLEWCFTGDIGVIDEDGEVTLLDRSKDVIITGGETVTSPEVESVLVMHQDVADGSVIGLKDEKWGEIITAVVVKKNTEKSDEEVGRNIMEHCRKNLSTYKAPKRVVFVDELPRTAVGKILKRNLREMTFMRKIDWK